MFFHIKLVLDAMVFAMSVSYLETGLAIVCMRSAFTRSDFTVKILANVWYLHRSSCKLQGVKNRGGDDAK